MTSLPRDVVTREGRSGPWAEATRDILLSHVGALGGTKSLCRLGGRVAKSAVLGREHLSMREGVGWEIFSGSR